MLFNSYFFIFVFLPFVYIVFLWIDSKQNTRATIVFLLSASIVFYGCWNISYLPLLLVSMVFNYTASRFMHKHKAWLYIAVMGNILMLVFFKYSDFFINNINTLFHSTYPRLNIDLPLGISFFTFTQIAFLVDKYRDKSQKSTLENFGLFISFFPHLMAGPVLHHKEIMPQFAQRRRWFSWENLAIGLSIFALGLIKKTLVADSLAPYANALFLNAEHGTVSAVDAWCGSIAYAFQLYFDFSGYSDMAIGLARMFGIIFPLNFNSPYKACNVIDFWRRWHISLSRFLRDYVYIPLGGNRQGQTKRYLYLMLTMLVGGFWHGAAWTFVAWGMLHGCYLILNHWWLHLQKQLFPSLNLNRYFIYAVLSWLLTFCAVTLAWVVFRAESFTGVENIILAMLSLKGSTSYVMNDFYWYLALLMGTGIVAIFAPNTYQLFYAFKPALETYGEIRPSRLFPQWRPSAFFATFWALFTLIALLTFGHVSAFLYYKF